MYTDTTLHFKCKGTKNIAPALLFVAAEYQKYRLSKKKILFLHFFAGKVIATHFFFVPLRAES